MEEFRRILGGLLTKGWVAGIEDGRIRLWPNKEKLGYSYDPVAAVLLMSGGRRLGLTDKVALRVKLAAARPDKHKRTRIGLLRTLGLLH
ncbi:MAG: hypothetical protein AAB455_00050 [Patescibacteria group bacterium]